MSGIRVVGIVLSIAGSVVIVFGLIVIMHQLESMVNTVNTLIEGGTPAHYANYWHIPVIIMVLGLGTMAGGSICLSFGNKE